MSFYGRAFIFSDIPSETYGLYISDLDASGISNSMGSYNVEIKEKKIFRRSVPYLFGVTGVPHLEFDMTVLAEEELTAEDFEGVQKWLFGQDGYKTLQIDQYDMESVVFYAILNSPEIIRVGNKIQGCKFHVVCNSPFGFTFPKVYTCAYGSSVVDAMESFYNSSDDTSNYLYPSCVITMNNIAGNITITNESDNNRVFEITGLHANEVLTINNSLQTISSSTGLKRLGNFNKHWMRFVPYLNTLHVQGNVESIVMTYSDIVKKIGG